VSRRWITGAILVAVVAAGLGLRLSYLASDSHNPLAQSYYGDLAHSIVAGQGFATNPVAVRAISELSIRRHRLVDPAEVNYASLGGRGEWQPQINEPIGGPLLLAGVWEITGREDYLPMQILQALVDAFCALLIFRISLLLFKRRVAALAAAALYALYLPIAWQTTIAYNDIWAVDFTIAIVAAHLEAVRSAHRWRWLVVCGLLTGTGVYFRPNLLILPALLTLATIPRAGWRRMLAQALVPTAIALILLAPWTIRNYERFHTFVFVRSGFWATMWVGLGELPNNIGASVSNDDVIEAKVRAIRPDLRPETPAWDSFVGTHFLIPELENHPLYYADIVARRIVRSTLLIYEGGTWMRHGATLPARRSPASLVSFFASHPLALLEGVFQPLVFLCAMLSLGLTWRSRRREHILLIALLLSMLMPYIVIHFEPRYVLPAASVYVVWIGLGIDLLAGRRLARLAYHVGNSSQGDLDDGQPAALGRRDRQGRGELPHLG
jgi:4-amino-4-deoxy-L-arabinose transferase-like glycosyltransferase